MQLPPSPPTDTPNDASVQITDVTEAGDVGKGDDLLELKQGMTLKEIGETVSERERIEREARSREEEEDRIASEKEEILMKTEEYNGNESDHVTLVSDDDNDDDFVESKTNKKVEKKPALAKDKKVGKGGRKPGSKNKTARKGAILDAIAKYQEDSGVSIINLPELKRTSRVLRSTGKVTTLDDDDAGSSCKDFQSNKEIDPECLDRMKMCISNSTTSWGDVIGLHEAKTRLREAAVLPIRRPDLFRWPRKASSGVLLYGPPGTGKTLLAKCVAAEAEATFFSITASDIMSKWLGEGEKNVAALFHIAEKRQPSIIFIDEIDSLLSSRKDGENESVRRVKTELLAQWDGMAKGKQLLVISASNRPFDLDSAALRRFGAHVYVPLPDKEARKEMFHRFSNSKEVNVELSASDQLLCALETTNYSAADIQNILSDSATWPLREKTFDEQLMVKNEELRSVRLADVRKSIENQVRTVDFELLEQYQQWQQK